MMMDLLNALAAAVLISMILLVVVGWLIAVIAVVSGCILSSRISREEEGWVLDENQEWRLEKKPENGGEDDG
jgi:hypothetical protein